MKKYMVVGNIAAKTGRIKEYETDDLDRGDGEGGLRFQDLLGGHGTDMRTFDTRPEAEACLASFELEEK